jgi:hypothetical protein
VLAAVLGVTLVFAAQVWAGGAYTSSGNQVNANIKTDDGGTAPIFDVIFPNGFSPTGGTCGTGCTVQTGANGNPSDIEFFLSNPAASINAVITLNSPFSCTSGNTITDRISRDRSTYIAQAPLTCSQPVVTPPPPPPPPKNCDSERAAVAAAAARVGALQAAIDVLRATEIQPTLDKLNDAIARTSKLAKEVDLVPFFQNGVRLRAGLALNSAQAEMEALSAKLQELGVKLRGLRDVLRSAQKDLDAALKALDACLKSPASVKSGSPASVGAALRPAGATLVTACTAQLEALSAAGARRAAYRELARIVPASSLRQASNGLADASRRLQALATVLAANGPKAATALANARAILGLTQRVGTVASRIASGAAHIRAKQAAGGKDVAAAKAALAKCQGK